MSERRRLLLVASVLVAVHLAALGAGFLSPYSPITQNRTLPYAPPTRLHLVDVAVTRGLTYVPVYVLGFAEAPLFAST